MAIAANIYEYLPEGANGMIDDIEDTGKWRTAIQQASRNLLKINKCQIKLTEIRFTST